MIYNKGGKIRILAFLCAIGLDGKALYPAMTPVSIKKSQILFLVHNWTKCLKKFPTLGTHATRLAGKSQIMLLFWIFPQIGVQFTTRAFITLEI